MKTTTHIAILFILISVFACNQDKGTTEVKDEETEEPVKNDKNTTKDEEPASVLMDLFDTDKDNTEVNEALEALTNGSDLNTMVYQMMGSHTIDKSTVDEQDLDALKKIMKKYPEIEESGGLAINENTIDLHFAKLAETLSKMDKEDLQAINAVMPKKIRSAASKQSKNPFEGTFIDESLNGYSFYSTAKNSQLYKQLAHATPEEAQEVLAEHYGISPEEVELLKSIEKQPEIRNEKQARKLSKAKYNEAVETALNNPNVSDNFKNLIKKQKAKQKRKAESFIKYSSRAREAFYKLNPGWHGEGDKEIGNTYIDSRNKQIYLPLGKLSFADEVIDHNPGDGGMYPKGSLGEPNMPNIDFTGGDPRICNIGLEGELTLQFTNNAITNIIGPDLYVFEMGAIEPTILELSKDGSEWLEVGKIDGGTAMVDIAEHVDEGETFTYIRLTDLNTRSDVPGADVDAVAAIGGALRLNLDSSVLFEFGKHKLKPEAEALLTELIPQIEEMGKGTIMVEGHTDNVGSSQANKTLSEKRAQSVTTLLKTLMKDKANNFKWKLKGYGDSQPVAPNDSDENRQKNRRVELLVLPQ
ncbi:OmpA family protein [Galbibacter sp. EGI 63066]|uniref:OmpA family protein n=1 Tax=Galbibacter sp. EGI 63066 TaxID=2993559 RepID=UPI002249781B|nr:OmpA family protein [Galbibacter sp. EGI 63066]MCX2678925.1 OmpA family protein [Galbibacter sp. EGI 63066]